MFQTYATMQELLRDEKADPEKILQHLRELAQELHNNVSRTSR